jgi:hypothetical protein
MSESVKRPAIDIEEFERRIRQPAPAATKPENDPLAELARLIGGHEDPLKNVFAAEAHAAPRREPAFEAQQPHYAPEAHYGAYDDTAMRGSIQPHQPSYPAYEPTRPVEDDPSWDMATEAPAYAEPRKPRLSRAAMIAAAVFGVGVLGIGGTYAFKGKMPGSREIATIQAASGPVKIAPPANDGDQQTQSASLLEKDAAKTTAKVVSREEQPIDLNTLPQKSARVISMQPGDSQAAAAQQQTSMGGGMANLIEPKKVKTVSVRPDGSIIPNSEMAGMGGNAPLPVARPASVGTPTSAAATPKASTPAPKMATRVSTTPAADVAPKAAPRAATETTKTKSAALDDEPTATTRGQWAAQLAASPSEDEARSTASRMASKYSSELGGRRPTFRKAEVNNKTVYRVRVGGLSKEEASSICQKISGCFVAKN